MNQPLVIVGAGGTSRELLDVVDALNADTERFRLVGFLDDEPAKQGESVDDVPVVGTLGDTASFPDCQFIVGIAHWEDPAARKRVVERLGLPRERYATLVHPSASVSRHARLGLGTAIFQNVVITSGTRIGDHVLILRGVNLGHDDVLADCVTIAPGAIVSGYVSLGESAYLGAGCMIRPGLEVGAQAIIGMGAVVVKDVAAGETVIGVAARPLGS